MIVDPYLMARMQQGRIDMANRCRAIANQELPAGWSIEYRKSLTGRCWRKKKHIATPEPKTRKSLYIFLHEVGHAITKKARHSYIDEYQAEIFAHETMRRHGLVVPREMTNRAKQYVRRKINQGVKRGLKNVDAKIAKWAGWTP